MSSLTARLRGGGAAAWAAGLALITLDFLSLPLLQWRVSFSYFLFALAALLTAWAEKREFGSRVFLYRLHDAVIYTPWKYLLLYFLWISVFAPFTPAPLASLVYAANGWLSLFTVALTSQFLFAERTVRGIMLLPDRLALVFRVYGGAVGGLLALFLLSLFLPGTPVETFGARQASLFLFFILGLPFLLWDAVKEGRRLLPRSLSLFTIGTGAVALLLVGRTYFQVSLLACLGCLLGLFVFKAVHARLPTLRIALVGAGAGAAALGAGAYLQARLLPPATLERARELLEARMRGRVEPVLEALRASNFLGKGVGVTEITGVWSRILAEAGVVGFALYGAFFLALGWDLLRVRHAPRVIVSNVALISVGVFLLFVSHYVENPYGAYVWIWYSIWGLVASTPKKKYPGPDA